VVLKDDDPPALGDCSPAAQRVFDALEEADEALSRSELQQRTRHAESTTIEALGDLRDAGLVERRNTWPVPLYGLAE
jgi:predicted transcriptional regulator